MTTSLTRDLKRQDVMMRKMFVDAIRGDGYKVANITPEVFHETLILAKDRNWIHPTSLAEAVRGSDSNVRKWFEKEAGKRSRGEGQKEKTPSLSLPQAPSAISGSFSTNC